MLVVDRLTKRYDRQAGVLDGVSFSVNKGEFVVLLGSSGCGKSTLFRCLTLMEQWDEGEIIYDGCCLRTIEKKQKCKIRSHWAFIQQQPSLIQRRTALENVLAGRLNNTGLLRVMSGLFSEKDKQEAEFALEKVGLSHRINARADTLSGGEQQRVSIARALVQGARIIYADEPVSSLDPAVSATVMKDLQTICAAEGIAVVCSLHQVHLAEQYATRIIALAGGEIVLDTPSRTLLQQEKEFIYGGNTLDHNILSLTKERRVL